MSGDKLVGILPVRDRLPPDLDVLAQPAAAEGIRTITVVQDEWASGANRFEGPGEVLLVARLSGAIVGIGGMTRDKNVPDALRMRRYYILPKHRRQGIGRMLNERLLVAAAGNARSVTLRAGSAHAGAFWERLGFERVVAETHTHQLWL